MWSASRPGQATTMSTPSRSRVICGFALTPPKMVVVQAQRLRQRQDRCLDLGRQLTRRRQDQRAR